MGPCRKCGEWTCKCGEPRWCRVCGYTSCHCRAIDGREPKVTHPGPMTEAQYKQRFGRHPVMDDLDRINCREAGQLGHSACGLCSHGMAKFMVCYDCHPEWRDTHAVIGDFIAVNMGRTGNYWQVRAAWGSNVAPLVDYKGTNAEQKAKFHAEALNKALKDPWTVI
jgi:hypothetical protein